MESFLRQYPNIPLYLDTTLNPDDPHQFNTVIVPIHIFNQSARLYEYYRTFDAEVAYIFQTIANYILSVPLENNPNLIRKWGEIKRNILLDENSLARKSFTIDEIHELIAIATEMLEISEEFFYLPGLIPYDELANLN